MVNVDPDDSERLTVFLECGEKLSDLAVERPAIVEAGQEIHHRFALRALQLFAQLLRLGVRLLEPLLQPLACLRHLARILDQTGHHPLDLGCVATALELRAVGRQLLLVVGTRTA